MRDHEYAHSHWRQFDGASAVFQMKIGGKPTCGSAIWHYGIELSAAGRRYMAFTTDFGHRFSLVQRIRLEESTSLPAFSPPSRWRHVPSARRLVTRTRSAAFFVFRNPECDLRVVGVRGTHGIASFAAESAAASKGLCDDWTAAGVATRCANRSSGNGAFSNLNLGSDVSVGNSLA